MALLFIVPQGLSTPPVVDEKPLNLEETRNPVLESAEYAYQVSRGVFTACYHQNNTSLLTKKTNLLSINEDGVKLAAKYVSLKLTRSSFPALCKLMSIPIDSAEGSC